MSVGNLKIDYIDINGIHAGASTSGGSNRCRNFVISGFLRFECHLVGMSSVGNTIPFVRDIAFAPSSNGNIEGHILTSANLLATCCDLDIGTESVDSVFSRGRASVIGGDGHGIRTSTHFDRFSCFTSAPQIRIGSSSTHSVDCKGCRCAFTNYIRTRNANQRRSSFNGNSSRSSARCRNATISIYNSCCEIIRSGSIQLNRNTGKIETRDFNTILIPNILFTSHWIYNVYRGQSTFADVSGFGFHFRSIRQCHDNHLDRVSSLASSTVNQSGCRSNLIPSVLGRSHRDGRSMLTVFPCIGNIACPTVSVHIEGDRLTSTG